MDEFKTLHEIIKAARANLDDGKWDYLTGGSESETTLRRNRQSLDSIAFRPRILRNVSSIDPSGKVLGSKVRIPVSLAPIGSLQTLHPTGGLGSAQAAEEYGVVSILSSVTQPSMEDVGKGTKHPKIFQLYVRGDRDWIADYAKRAIDLGYVGFCLTVDVAVYSRRERDMITRYTPTARVRAEGMSEQASLDWDLVDWFKDKFDIPLAIKGIATAEDATMAVEHGVEVVYVSNHGGRQLDHGRGGIDTLPEVVMAVDGKAEIIFDGGVMRGSDVVKAIAFGANSVAIGKLEGLALAAGGPAAVVRMLEIVEDEMRSAMGLLGVTALDQLGREHLHPARPVAPATVFSAHPHLDLPTRDY